MRLFKQIILGFFLLTLIVSSGFAVDSALQINLDVNEFRLKNGMLFLVVERPATPQVACRLAIRAGSALEESGKTGIAHMLEHMMFKGTKNFGSLDFKKDQALQERIEAAYQVVLKEQQKRHPDQDLINKKLTEMDKLRLEVQKIYVPQAFSSQLGRNGAVGVNAFTTEDQTQYMVSVPSDMLEQLFSILSEQIFEPAWREFYVEKEVVQREWAFRYINDAGGAARLDLNTTAYTAHPYRNPTIGWKADIEKFNTADAIAFHKRYYNPTNAVCVLVGDVSVENAKKLAKIYFARYPAGQPAPETVTSEPPQQGPRKNIRFLKGARTPLVRIAFHGAPMGTKDFYALDAMTMILSHGRSARMTQNIINQGLAVGAWAYNPDNRYGGLIVLGGSPNEPAAMKNEKLSEDEKRLAYLEACEELEAILLAEAEKMKSELVSEHELKRIKILNRRERIESMRSNNRLAGTLATLEVQIGWRYLADYLDEIETITPEDIRRAAQKYIRTDNQSSVYVIPGGQPDRPPVNYTEVRSISGSAAARTLHHGNTENISIYPTPQVWKHPLSFKRQPTKIEYPKADMFDVADTTVFYLPDKELPLIDLTILVKAGSVDVEDSKTGLADLLSSVIIEGGTETYSPGELARLLDENAIQIGVSIGEEQSTIHLSVLKEYWQEGWRLLQEVLTRPGFDPGVLDVAKRREMIGLQRQGGDAQSVAMREGMIWHFNNHPYGRDPLLGLKTIPDITRDDLKKFLNTYFVPSNMVAAVSGDIEKARLVSGLSKFFQALPKTEAPTRKLNEPDPTPPVLALIYKPGQVQSQVVLSLPGVKRSHPDYWKVSLLMDIFGGNDSLMYTRLRDDLGLVYSAGFYQIYKWNAGLLMGFIGCKGDKTSAAVKETIDIMKSLQKDVPQKELEQKRLDALNSFVFNVDTKSELVEVYSRYYMRQEPLDTLERIQDAFFQAGKNELQKLAQRLLDPNKIQIIVVGDKMTPVKTDTGDETTLEEDLITLAKTLGLPYQEIALR
ncbi:MAG: insulinase family protein [Desulfobacterales bacterium]|nr:MAG: insulinase family protein [Desulfobacterales bacterium]